jgi:hypothetical protein
MNLYSEAASWNHSHSRQRTACVVCEDKCKAAATSSGSILARYDPTASAYHTIHDCSKFKTPETKNRGNCPSCLIIDNERLRMMKRNLVRRLSTLLPQQRATANAATSLFSRFLFYTSRKNRAEAKSRTLANGFAQEEGIKDGSRISFMKFVCTLRSDS